MAWCLSEHRGSSTIFDVGVSDQITSCTASVSPQSLQGLGMSADSPGLASPPHFSRSRKHTFTHARTDAKAVKSRIKRFPGKEEGRPGGAAEVLSDATIVSLQEKKTCTFFFVGRESATCSKVSEKR